MGEGLRWPSHVVLPTVRYIANNAAANNTPQQCILMRDPLDLGSGNVSSIVARPPNVLMPPRTALLLLVVSSSVLTFVCAVR